MFSSDLTYMYISITYHIIIIPLDSLRVDVTSHLQALWCTTSLSVLQPLNSHGSSILKYISVTDIGQSKEALFSFYIEDAASAKFAMYKIFYMKNI